MKQLFRMAALFLLTAFFFTINSCKKKTEDSTCKTCRAFGIDGQAGERKVCSEAEEAKFRSDFSGKEITCQ